MNPSLQYLVATEANRAGTELQKDQLEKLVCYVDLLGRWGKRMNLTGDPDPRVLVQHHLADVFYITTWLRNQLIETQSSDALSDALPAADIGSGAGLPGLPLAILCPAISMTLVEPLQRRCSFLRTVVHELSVDVKITSKRLQEASLPAQALALSRATFAPEDWLRLGVDIVRAGGHVVAFLVRPDDAPSPPRSLSLDDTVSYQLHDGTPRCLAFYRKAAEAQGGRP